MSEIRKFTRNVAERYRPEKIILFGSYADGTPHQDSDVDILVVIATRSQLGLAFQIHWAIQPPFPLDLVVRTPKNMKWRLAAGDSFLQEVVAKGKVLYETTHPRMGSKSRSRSRHRKADRRKQKSIA